MVLTATVAGDRVALPDGRWLGYAEYGDPAGRPVLLFHGLPGSRLFRPPDESVAASCGIRLIAVDRPGFGLSCRCPGRTLLDWPDDVTALADELGLDTLGIIGVSAGGPYAAACALRIPERVCSVALVSSVAPLSVPGVTRGMDLGTQLGFWLARHAWPPRWWLYPSVGSVALMAHVQPELLWQLAVASAPRQDQAVLQLPGVHQVLTSSIREAYRQGLEGHVQDAMLIARDWGFRVQDISVDVQLWHGGRDVQVPPAMGRWLGQAIPRTRTHWLADEGHLLVLRAPIWRQILDEQRRAC